MGLIGVFVIQGALVLAKGTESPTYPPHEMHCRMKHHLERNEMQQQMAEALGLSAKQQSRIDAIHQAFHQAHHKEMDEKKSRFETFIKLQEQGVAKAEMDASWLALEPDFKQVKADRQQLDQQIDAVLTLEQRKKIAMLRQQHQPPMSPPPPPDGCFPPPPPPCGS